jgi:5-methylcytosine-specific restriction endonuclease McrA
MQIGCSYGLISWINYGKLGERGAWEVDHSIPVSRGGSDHMNNLFASCISCNREKSDLTGTQFQRSLETEEESSLGELLFGIGVAAVGIGLLKALMSR